MLLGALYSVMLLPLLGAVAACLFSKFMSKVTIHRMVITFLMVSCGLAGYLFYQQVCLNHEPLVANLYSWLKIGNIKIDVSFLLDKLSATMLLVVTFVSLMVHIYSISYMKGDPGYQRFFSYLALFTGSMLVLVLANNFFMLFLGWEAVGLSSYLLIGFWFENPVANVASYKAFCVNRLGDFSFLLGVALIVSYCRAVDYQSVFQYALVLKQTLVNVPIFSGQVSVITLVCLLLFVGAMAKSAQVPLHVWLPDSMAGPTPVSALIHAATMVTAGIYLVSRMSPLFELSETARVVVLVVGASTSLFLGLVALVEYDIKRIIAYSTLSQLGYMVVALGISAYDAAIFHLMMHAFFKALLFLAAGSVILAMHHEQDIRKMGGLYRYLPLTYLAFVGAILSMIAVPPLSGFYSKDVIIQAARIATLPGSSYAYFCVQVGALITVLYSLRLIVIVFHRQDRWRESWEGLLPSEARWQMLLPFLALLIPSLGAGAYLVGPMLFNSNRLLGDSIFTGHDILADLGLHYHGPYNMAFAAFHELTIVVLILGALLTWLCYVVYPQFPQNICRALPNVYAVLVQQYGFDKFNQIFLVNPMNKIGHVFYQLVDVKIIDGVLVKGSARLLHHCSKWLRCLQTGYLYHYMLTVIVGLALLLLYYVLM